ncbi:nuclear transport factor 2 family protein [Streptomyces mirabilis]|uniref:nuclear transport factor 2 family protein n=1 Tax=Streptomyces mirabilis TaxID=68239 RepID=UPI0032488E98
MPNGLQTLRDLLSEAADIHHEMHGVLADGDLVAVHDRVTGWGPKPVIVEGIFPVDRGKIVEHWDVVQHEVPASETVSGNPMISGTRELAGTRRPHTVSALRGTADVRRAVDSVAARRRVRNRLRRCRGSS